MTGWLAAVFVAVVVGGGWVIGRLDRPSLPLSLLATAVVAPVVRVGALRPGSALGPLPLRAADGVLVHSGPFDRHERGRSGAGSSGGPGHRPVLVEVWLQDAGRDAPAEVVARWPPGTPARTGEDPPTRRYAIRHADRVLGWLVVSERLGRPLEPIERRLVGDLCAQAGLALRHVQLREDLRQRMAESEERARQLRTSRQRIVAAADAERRRLEPEFHDGAQQHLIALVINLALARELLRQEAGRLLPLVDALLLAVHEAVAVLEDLDRGIYPRQLVDEGVAAALRAATATSAVPVQIEDSMPSRYGPPRSSRYRAAAPGCATGHPVRQRSQYRWRDGKQTESALGSRRGHPNVLRCPATLLAAGGMSLWSREPLDHGLPLVPLAAGAGAVVEA